MPGLPKGQMHRFFTPVFLLLLAAPAQAKELKILTGAGMSMPVRALAADFGQRTGTTVSVVSDTAGGVQKRMEADEKFDLVSMIQVAAHFYDLRVEPRHDVD